MRIFLITIILLVSLITTQVYSQNIYSALQHNRDESIKGKVPIEIFEENLFYNSSGKEVKKSKKRLNSRKKILLEERFNQNGKLEARLIYCYDSTGLYILTRKFERWTSLGYSSETTFYQYDNNGYLIRVTDMTDENKKIQETVLTNNEKGNPTKLELFDGNGNAYGVELATYDYQANKVYTEVQDGRGNSISRDTLTIKFESKLDSTIKYNEHGDVIESSKYFYDYEYDDFGNWTTMKIFKNVRSKKKNDRIFKRRFKYGV